MTVASQHTVPFVHLRVHSAYSLGVGRSTPKELCEQARRLGYPALALTDIDGTYGFVEFHHAARSAGIKPIYGANLTLGGEAGKDGTGDEVYSIILLALDRNGLKNLCAVTSTAATRRLQDRDLETADLEGRSDGLVCIVKVLPADADGDLYDGAGEAYRTLLSNLKALYGDRVFFELPAADPGRNPRAWTEAAEGLDVRPVLTGDVRFAGQSPFRAGTTETFEEKTGAAGTVLRSASDERHGLATVSEISAHYSTFPDAYSNSTRIASMIPNDLLEVLDRPVAAEGPATLFEPPSATRDELFELLELYFDREFPAGKRGQAGPRKRYREILKRETLAITDDDLAETFLKFHEIVTRLRRMNLRLGPATGLRLQSFCAYLLGITGFNPYEADERFLPDLREDAKEYRILELQLAGEDRPAAVTALYKLFDSVGIGYVPTVDHITPARALRQAAQEMEVDQGDYRELARVAADHPGVGLKQLCEENKAIGHMYKRSAQVRELIARAAAREGLPCGFIRSKRTLIVSPRPLREFLGHTINPETGELFFQATRDAFPTESIYRVDISTLTAVGVLSEVAETVDGSVKAFSDWRSTLLDRAETFDQVSREDVDGVYLLETPFTRRLAASFDISSFGDLANFLALMRYRGGDLSFAGRVEAFKSAAGDAVAEGSDVSFLLNDTRGWVLYHDQLREILSALTGLSGREAVGLLGRFRRGEPGDLAALRRDFMSLTVETELPMEEAKTWFKRVLYHASRTLSRQRILADAIIVGRMLSYKRRNRAAFFTALLNNYKPGDTKYQGYMGIVVAEGLLLAPGVNRSGRAYVCENGLIRPPLSLIEGLSERAVRAILRERKQGPFEDSGDLTKRLGEKTVTPEEVEMLVHAGALEPGRDAVPGEVRRMEQPAPPAPDRKRKDTSQLDFLVEGRDFPPGGESADSDRSDGAAADSPADPGRGSRLEEANDPQKQKDGNKGRRYSVVSSLAEFYPHPSASPVELAGRVRDLHEFKTSSGDKTRFFVLFDSESSVRVFVPGERFGREGEALSDGSRVLVRGIVRLRDGKKVCDAMEVTAAEGGARGVGETTPHESADRDP